MTDGIEIVINGKDNFSSAARSAAASMEKLNQATKTQGDAALYTNGILNKWTASQYKAAEAGGLLVDKARALGSEVAKGNMTIAQANRQYAAFERQMKNNVWQSMTFGEKMSVVSSKLSSAGMAMAKFGAAGAVVGFVGKQMYNLAREGARIEFVRTKFDRLAQAAGSTGNVFLQQLRTATRGTVSDFGLLEQGSNLLQLGLARNTDEAVRLSKVMTALGMDTGELTLALANQSKRRLDQLGLSLEQFNKIEARLKASGMSKEEAFREAFMQTAEKTIETTGNMADTEYGSFLRLEAAIRNLFDDFKTGIPTMNFFGESVRETVGDVTMFLNGIRALQRGETILDWDAIWGGKDVWVRQATEMETAAKRGKKAADLFLLENKEYLNQWKNLAGRRYKYIFGTAEERYAPMFQRGAAMTDFYRARYGVAETAPAPEKEMDYGALMSSGLALTKINEQYAQSMDEINGALSQQIAKLQELQASGYAPTSEKIIEQKNAIRELHDASIQADEARVASAQQTVSALLEQMGATEDVQLEFARASGQISDEAYKQAEAFNAIAEAIKNGDLSAQQGAQAIENLMQNMSILDGMSVDAYINLYMKTYGMAAGNTVQTLAPLHNITQTVNNAGVATTAMASGGPISGGFAITGDTTTGLTPYSELVYAPHGGYVFNAQQTRQILATGAIRPVRRPTGGWVAPLPMDDSPTLVSTAMQGAYYKPPKKSNSANAPLTTVAPASVAPASIGEIGASASIDEMQTTFQATIKNITDAISSRTKETNNLLRQLIAKTASERGIASAVTEQSGKFS